jgi:hypothetical protein
MTVTRDNLDALTGLRFVAAFTIALGHYFPPWREITGIGMPLFFTLSGFIIHYVYADTFTGGWRRATSEFAIARFSRIYPLYFALLAYPRPDGSTAYHRSGRPGAARLSDRLLDLVPLADRRDPVTRLVLRYLMVGLDRTILLHRLRGCVLPTSAPAKHQAMFGDSSRFLCSHLRDVLCRLPDS